MYWFFSAIPYFLAVGIIVNSLFNLLKEWHDYKNARLRMAVVFAFIIVGVLTIVSLYLESEDKKKAGEDSTRLEGQVKGLEGEVKAAHEAQERNTELFVDSFAKLSKEVSSLRTQVQTEALQKKLAAVDAELQKTQKALAPGPKAVLAFSFEPFINPPLGSAAPVAPVTNVKLPVLADGTVHIEFTVLNLSDVDAVDGGINILLCDDCKFAKEPAGFKRLSGQRPTERHMAIRLLPARTSLETKSMDIIVPIKVAAIVVGLVYRCHTCIIPDAVSTGTVYLVR